ncbi:hypothetical protein AMELA_G00148190 [Ameiurus melas]|uniref:Uncharacterized protein n=1 Tax=Ameiurus melas TaxID=219545 RepID=A0A7J6AH37_AMEME|nr:hypothetical protein AMELA_G00148190 [Ameiurus melas]
MLNRCRPPSQLHQTPSDDSECCSAPCLQPAQDNPCNTPLHLPPLASCSCLHQVQGAAPSYLNSLLKAYIPSRNLRSASDRHLVVPTQRGVRSLSRTFTLTVPQWWNALPISIRTAESLTIFKK